MNRSRTEVVQAEQLDKRQKILELIPSVPDNQNRPQIVVEDSSAKLTDENSLISSRNQQFQGFLKIFHAHIEKSYKLIANAKDYFWDPIILYDENIREREHKPIERVHKFSSVIPLTHELYDFVTECLSIFRNFMIQIALYKEMEFPNRKLVESVKLWRSLGDLLAQLVILDELVTKRPQVRYDLKNLVKHCSSIQSYRETLHDQRAITEQHLEQLTDVYNEYERLLFSGNSFREACQQTLGDIDTNQQFAKDMYDAVMFMYQNWERTADEDQPDRRGLLSICALAVFYHNHFANFAQPKLIQTVFMAHKKIFTFILFSDVSFVPSTFLMREVSNDKLFDKKLVANIEKIQKDMKTAAHIETVIDDAHSFVEDTKVWVEEVDERLKERQIINSYVNIAKVCLNLSELFLKGIRLADTMTRLMKSLIKYLKIARFDNDTVKLSSKNGYRLFDIVESVKTIALILQAHWFWFSEGVIVGEQQCRYYLIQQIEIARGSLREKKSKFSENELIMREDAFRIARNVLLSTANPSRLAIVAVSLEIAIHDSFIHSVNKKHLFSLLRRIENLCEPRKLAARVTDCSFLALMESFVKMYWAHVLIRKPTEDQILMWSATATDCVAMWKKFRPEAERKIGLVYYETFRKEFLAEVCRRIENDLRILAHPHLQIDNNHHLSEEDSKYLQQLINLKPFKIYDRVYNVKEFVTRHLERSFYNLTIVVPNDGQTYVKMAEIANKKYGLQLINGDLQQGGIDESCDIMDMIVNMAGFVKNYDFSLSEQFFIEKQSPNRSLRVISRDDLVKAFRKHGSGLLPTVLNMTYQVLRVKLNVFYKFMSDDHIKAQLQFEIQTFEADKSTEKKYSMKSAERFASKIASIGGKVMGTNENLGSGNSTMNYYEDDKPKSYLDKFRELITQIGNTLSFAKLMSAASNSLNSETGQNLTAEVQEMVDQIRIMNIESQDDNQSINRILHFSSCREKETELNNLLVNVFRNSLKSDCSENLKSYSPGSLNSRKSSETVNEDAKNEGKMEDLNHLRNFYTIIPALTISQVEQMCTCRTRIRNNLITDCARELTITNDGFSVGIAYILTILCIWPQLDSLRWFESAIEYTEEEKKNAIESLSTSKGASLKVTRMELLTEEYKHLFNTLNSARMFFEFLDPEIEHDIDEDLESF